MMLSRRAGGVLDKMDWMFDSSIEVSSFKAVIMIYTGKLD